MTDRERGSSGFRPQLQDRLGAARYELRYIRSSKTKVTCIDLKNKHSKYRLFLANGQISPRPPFLFHPFIQNESTALFIESFWIRQKEILFENQPRTSVFSARCFDCGVKVVVIINITIIEFLLAVCGRNLSIEIYLS